MISISKIRKINLIIKNWILNGIRELDKGSNPHSKGEIFSRFFKDLIEIKKFNNIISKDKIKNIKEISINVKIIYINLILNFLIGN